MNKLKYITFLLLATCSVAFSQGTNEGDGLGSEDIIVIKEYEARIADAKKIVTNPTTKEVEIEKQKLNYETPEKLVELEYPAHTVKPLAMPKIKREKFLTSYAKLGFGVHIGDFGKVYMSPLAEIVYNNNETENLVYGGHYKHFSAWGGKVMTQKFRNEDARIYAKYFMKSVEMGLSVNFKQNVDYYYGNGSDSTEAPTIRQAAQNIGADLFFKNAKFKKNGIDYNQKVGFNYFTDAHDGKEWYIDYDGVFTKTFKNLHNLDVMLGVNVSNYIPTVGDDLEREVMQVGAAYTFNDDNWKLKAGIKFAFGEVAADKQFDFYPIIYTEKRLYKHALIFYTSWSRSLGLNTYQKFIAENPAIYINPVLKNARVEDRIAGFKGTFKNLTYNARFTNKVIKDMPLYMNDSSNISRFDVVYEKTMFVYNINAEVGFNWAKNFKTQVTVDYRIFEPTFEEKAWNLPSLDLNLSATYNLKNKIFFDLEFYTLLGAWAKNDQGIAEKLKGTADINLGVNYKYSKNLSMFIKLNNLAHSKQARYYNYNDYGFNGLIGVKFEF
jgi:hypothetical protein